MRGGWRCVGRRIGRLRGVISCNRYVAVLSVAWITIIRLSGGKGSTKSGSNGLICGGTEVFEGSRVSVYV